ncbi:uncharacterized protein LOC132383590 isoform X1 [Hypanus sabinus]|uniref:uncharacterized protein LOC132383590 isoform X1 n=1 Tax=Hypanus sabinus TaxID=79690 RepID=UPI0028C44A5E|nr:uncharacterized protein LOC132383590 isoform X1 [Hypanus sabinus]XP_059810724.1 uncharacterized protein LOC132383590 isoform X1 [Hypanus sabinus]XP_059810726.1 uncharacterized protein LOC132383590 isoform X1 [Hypanus sabinus]XP_059810727.1 uncharacterized protein LOC132383590 isoform X1 [Hypanus sabinus]
MAPDPHGVMYAAGPLQLPQLFLAASVLLPLLLIPVLIICAFCRSRFSERVRCFDGQLKATFTKNNSGSVRLSNDLDSTSEKGMITRRVDLQTVTEINESQVVQNIPSTQLTNHAGNDVSNDERLYEELRDVHVSYWNTNRGSLSVLKPNCMNRSEEMSSAELNCNPEVSESTSEETQAPIYARVVKQRSKESQSRVRERPEVEDEGNMDEAPPVPAKHLDDDDSAPC